MHSVFAPNVLPMLKYFGISTKIGLNAKNAVKIRSEVFEITAKRKKYTNIVNFGSVRTHSAV